VSAAHAAGAARIILDRAEGNPFFLLAERAPAQGDRDACRAHAAQAYAVFTRLGVPRYVERTERLAPGWGAPLPG
jgi:hypothetical protein